MLDHVFAAPVEILTFDKRSSGKTGVPHPTRPTGIHSMGPSRVVVVVAAAPPSMTMTTNRTVPMRGDEEIWKNRFGNGVPRDGF